MRTMIVALAATLSVLTAGCQSSVNQSDQAGQVPGASASPSASAPPGSSDPNVKNGPFEVGSCDLKTTGFNLPPTVSNFTGFSGVLMDSLCPLSSATAENLTTYDEGLVEVFWGTLQPSITEVMVELEAPGCDRSRGAAMQCHKRDRGCVPCAPQARQQGFRGIW